MEALVWIGAALTVLGLVGLAWCIVTVVRARKTAADDAELKARLQRVVAMNLGALGVSALGLMLVVAGVLLA